MEVRNYDGFFNKFRGLMFRKNIDYAIRLRCNGIHTFFMFENIDIVLTDRNNIVVGVFFNFKPNRIVFPRRNVYFTYEFPCGYINNVTVGSVFNPC